MGWGADALSPVERIKALDGSPATLQDVCVKGSLDAAITANPSGFLQAIAAPEVPEPIRYYVAARVLGTNITNEQSLFAHGILFNNYIVSDAAQGWTLLAEYYRSLPPEMEDAAILLKMREAHWNISDLAFATFTAGKVKTGQKERSYQEAPAK